MRNPSEMYIASCMQNMVQICVQNACFAAIFIYFFKNYFGALGVESPHGGAMDTHSRETWLPRICPKCLKLDLKT